MFQPSFQQTSGPHWRPWRAWSCKLSTKIVTNIFTAHNTHYYKWPEDTVMEKRHYLSETSHGEILWTKNYRFNLWNKNDLTTFCSRHSSILALWCRRVHYVGLIYRFQIWACTDLVLVIFLLNYISSPTTLKSFISCFFLLQLNSFVHRIAFPLSSFRSGFLFLFSSLLPAFSCFFALPSWGHSRVISADDYISHSVRTMKISNKEECDETAHLDLL